MKSTNIKLQVAFKILVLCLMASCSPTKSTSPNTTSSSASLLISADKPVALCNRTADSNFTFNTAVAQSTPGVYDNDVLKMKFSFISAASTTAGNTVSFFKWKVNGTVAELDPTPLTFYAYNASTGASVSTASTSYVASKISTSNGFYIKLNDVNGVYQVIKTVVYNSSGKVVSQVNSLIPAFYASPVDYQSNADGSTRADILQALHPLAAQISSGASVEQFQQSMQSFCF